VSAHRSAASELREDEPRLWTVLVGADAASRTAVLQAIALLAAGLDGANRLAAMPSWPGRPTEDVEIGAHFEFSADPGSVRRYPGDRSAPEIPPRFLRSELLLAPSLDGLLGSSEYVDTWAHLRWEVDLPAPSAGGPLQEARTLGLSRWFVAGYGLGRATAGTTADSPPLGHALGRLASLFTREPVLGLQLYSLVPDAPRYLETIERTLLREDQFSSLDGVVAAMIKGAELSPLGATRIPADRRGFVAWLADMIGHLFLDAGAAVALDDMSGLVLIDRLELHVPSDLHHELIPGLKARFPRMQFIVTTDAPAVLAGAERDEILGLQHDHHHIRDENANAPWLSIHDVVPVDSHLAELARELSEMTGRAPTGALDSVARELPILHRSMIPERLLVDPELAPRKGSRNREALGLGDCTFFWVGSCAYDECHLVLVWAPEAEWQPPDGLGLYRSYLSMVLETCFHEWGDYLSGRRPPEWYPGLRHPPIPLAGPPSRTFEVRRLGSVPIADHLVAVIPDKAYFADNPATLRQIRRFSVKHEARWIEPERGERPHVAARRFVAEFLRERGIE